MYIGPEFQLGQVYDGSLGAEQDGENVVLYRPVYVCVRKPSSNFHQTNDTTPQSINELNNCEPGPSRCTT